MTNPHLVILVRTDKIPILGSCSSCEGILFSTGAPVGMAREHQQKLGGITWAAFSKDALGQLCLAIRRIL